MAKTKLDLILDKVKAKHHEVTFDVRDYTEAQKQRIISTARQRGLDASSDGKFILVRDLRSMHNPSTGKLPKNKWVPVKAVKQCSDGSIQVRN